MTTITSKLKEEDAADFKASVANEKDRKDYHKKYYEQHKKEISSRRKTLYRNDPEYRKRVQIANSVNFSRKRSAEAERRKQAGIGDTKHYDEDGNQLFTIADLSNFTGKAQHTIRKYHAMGILPLPTHTSTRNWRLYTGDQIKWFRHCLDKCTHAPRNYTDGNCLAEMIRPLWNKPFISEK